MHFFYFRSIFIDHLYIPHHFSMLSLSLLYPYGFYLLQHFQSHVQIPHSKLAESNPFLFFCCGSFFLFFFAIEKPPSNISLLVSSRSAFSLFPLFLPIFIKCVSSAVFLPFFCKLFIQSFSK